MPARRYLPPSHPPAENRSGGLLWALFAGSEESYIYDLCSDGRELSLTELTGRLEYGNSDGGCSACMSDVRALHVQSIYLSNGFGFDTA